MPAVDLGPLQRHRGALFAEHLKAHGLRVASLQQPPAIAVTHKQKGTGRLSLRDFLLVPRASRVNVRDHDHFWDLWGVAASDHAPVYAEVELAARRPRPQRWKPSCIGWRGDSSRYRAQLEEAMELRQIHREIKEEEGPANPASQHAGLLGTPPATAAAAYSDSLPPQLADQPGTLPATAAAAIDANSYSQQAATIGDDSRPADPPGSSPAVDPLGPCTEPGLPGLSASILRAAQQCRLPQQAEPDGPITAYFKRLQRWRRTTSSQWLRHVQTLELRRVGRHMLRERARLRAAAAIHHNKNMFERTGLRQRPTAWSSS